MQEKVIRHEGGKWVLYTRDGSRKLGTYDTEEQAKKRERQIQFFRHQKGEGAMDILDMIATAFGEFGAWLKAYKPGMEETPAQFRYRLRDPGDFREGTLRTMSLPGATGVQLIVGRLKPENVAEGRNAQSAVAQAVHFSKEQFTEAEAKKWIAAHPDMKALPEAEMSNGLAIYKQKDGVYRWVGWVSNHFRDNDNPPEIISGKAHQDYVAWVDKNEVYPDLWLWHTPGTRIGKADLVDFTDGFLLASGIIDAGAKDTAERLASMGELTMSHGFVRMKPMDGQGVTDTYRIFEASIVPQGVEANPFTAFKAMEVTMNDKKRKFLVDALGEDKVAAIENDTATLRKAAEEAGVDWKAVEGEDATEVSTTVGESVAGPALTAQVDVAGLAAAIAEHLQLGKLSEMLAGLQTKVEAHDMALAEVAGAVKVLSRTDDAKVAEALTPKAALTFAWTGKPASKSAETVVKAGDPEDNKLIDRRPWLADIAASAAASLATR